MWQLFVSFINCNIFSISLNAWMQLNCARYLFYLKKKTSETSNTTQNEVRGVSSSRKCKSMTMKY